MRYMPERNVVVCGVGKVGTTSMYDFVYYQNFGEMWPVKNGGPYVQEVHVGAWRGAFEQVVEMEQQQKIMQKAYSFALIRDPKERLLSAWKSKVAFDEGVGVDVYDRAFWDEHSHRYRGLVPLLQRLRGAEENITCLDLKTYAEALVDIHRLGRQKYLDRHFLPQDQGCFYRFGPEHWSRVATITDDVAMKELAAHLGNFTNFETPVIHASTATITVTQEVADMFDFVTKNEYTMLKDYLPKGHRSEMHAGSVRFPLRSILQRIFR